MISKRPYLLRAMHEWITDSGNTPHILVDCSVNEPIVPRQYIEDDKIVLNISDHATVGLLIADDRVAFRARFSGQPFDVNVPVGSIVSIYARETGDGMVFNPLENPVRTSEEREPAPIPNNVIAFPGKNDH